MPTHTYLYQPIPTYRSIHDLHSSQQLDQDLVKAGDLLETAERLRDLGEWPSAQRLVWEALWALGVSI